MYEEQMFCSSSSDPFESEFNSGGSCMNTGGTQLLAFFQSITPALHASVNFSPWLIQANNPFNHQIPNHRLVYFTETTPPPQLTGSICLTRWHQSMCTVGVNDELILWSTNKSSGRPLYLELWGIIVITIVNKGFSIWTSLLIQSLQPGSTEALCVNSLIKTFHVVTFDTQIWTIKSCWGKNISVGVDEKKS